MPHFDVPQFLGLLVVMLAAAKLCGAAAQKIGQPAVLGELMAGVILGASVLGLIHSGHPVSDESHVAETTLDALHAAHSQSNVLQVNDPQAEILHVLLFEIGVIILLFEIGLETDLRKLLKVGGESVVVAIVGVALPFALGYAVCHFLGLSNLTSIVSGATLTATSVGITARVLSDLNRLQEPESQIVLGAAVIDDVVGLVILAVVQGLAEGQRVTASSRGSCKSPPSHSAFLSAHLCSGCSSCRPWSIGFHGQSCSARPRCWPSCSPLAWLGSRRYRDRR